MTDPGGLPVAQAYVMTGEDGGRLAIEQCPHCSRIHTHEPVDLDRPRTCGRTLRKYWLLPPEAPVLSEIRTRAP